MDRRFICPCGLTCCDCLFFKKDIYDAARRLKELMQHTQLDTFLKLVVKNKGWTGIAKHLGRDEKDIHRYFEPFTKMDDFFEVLEGIISLECKTPCTESGGCSLGGDVHECEALKCIRSRKLDGCWECAEAGNCEKLVFLKRNYGETIEGNLKIIKEEGFDAVKSRGDRYYAWQKRTK